MHQSRKYSPTRFIADVPPLTVAMVNKSPITPPRRTNAYTKEDIPGEMSPPPTAKMRHLKVKGVRRHSSPQPRRVESLEWSERTPDPLLRSSEDKPDSPSGPGPAPRNRKRGFRPPDVRTIFSPREKDPRVREESGEGHNFCPGASGAWCDVCCEYIFHNRLTCTGCKYTCHPACRDRVSLDCHPGGPSAPLSPLCLDHLNNNNSPPSDVEKDREVRTHLSREEIKLKVDQYNASTKDHLKMTLNSSGVYTGFIQVQLELRRPVTVRGGGGGGAAGEEAFYLPRGATNTLHISSNNTVREVIQALLKKFTVADNPAKYALYKRCCREEQVYVCRLAVGEHPLFLRLVAGPDTDTLGFVLREQQTGEVMWDAFSIPELRNFLRILEKEEQEQMLSVTRRYDNYRLRLQEALKATGGPG